MSKTSDLIERFDALRDSGICSPTTRGLLDDAQALLDGFAALNDVFLDMRDRAGGYLTAPPLHRQFSNGATAFEWAASSVRRAADGEEPLNPPIPLRRLRDDDRTEDAWRYHVLTCATCGERFVCTVEARVDHVTYPDMPEHVYHHGRALTAEKEGTP